MEWVNLKLSSSCIIIVIIIFVVIEARGQYDVDLASPLNNRSFLLDA